MKGFVFRFHGPAEGKGLTGLKVSVSRRSRLVGSLVRTRVWISELII